MACDKRARRPPYLVSERLGQASIAIILDTYSHVLPNLQDEAARQLGALLVAPAPGINSQVALQAASNL